MEWKDLAFGVQSMVWQDPSATLRKTGRQEDRKTGRQEIIIPLILFHSVERFLIVIKQPMDFQSIVVELLD